MKNKEEVVLDFIRKRGYLMNERVLGIVFYDGYIPGYSNHKSDIGLQVIMDDKTKFIVKQNIFYEEIEIEFYERSLYDIYQLVDDSYRNFGSSIVSIIGSGKIVYDRTGEMRKLQQYILQKYTVFLPGIFGDISSEMLKIATNQINQLQFMLEKDSPFFTYNYYVLIEQIKQFYIRLHGFSDVQTIDAFMAYSNFEKRKRLNNIPDDDFIKIYIDSIIYEGSNEEKMEMANRLYDYSIGVKFDSSTYQGYSKSKNSYLNIFLQ